MPKVSVVISAYNHARFIPETAGSVLGQSERDLELIVVDDGSTDETLQVLSGIYDRRMRVLTQANQGTHAAINRGLAEATGKYLAVLNSDDAYHPRRLEKTLARLESDPAVGLVGSYIEVVDAEGKTLGVKHGYHDLEPWLLEAPERSFRAGDDLRAALLTENYWSTTSNYVFRRECYEQVGPFRPLRYTHDWDFALRMARVTGLALLEEPLMRYRVHSHNTIRENQAAMVFEICWCLAVHLPAHAAEAWFAAAPEAQRADQLLHSIYAFGCDKVLSALLVQRLNDNPALALRLLEPGDPARARYLEYIERHLPDAGQPEAEAAAPRRPRLPAGPLRRVAGELREALRHWRG